MSRNKLYVLLSAACIAGYGWLIFTFYRGIEHLAEPHVCLFKQVTTIPCPSCGSTRSVLSLIKGDIAGAFYWNPFGLVLIAILLIAPLWISYDLISRKDTLFSTYSRTEMQLRNKWIAIPAILIVIINWIWNINKGL